MKQYTVTGMSCAACQARVEKAVSALDGVDCCAVSLLTNSMGVEGSASESDVIEAVEKAGYGAIPRNSVNIDKPDQGYNSLYADEEEALKDRESPVLKKRLAFSVIFLLVLMYFSMGRNMLGLPLGAFFEDNYIAVGLVQMILAAIVMRVNKKFFVSGFKGLARRAPNMDTLVAIGSSVSFVWSVIILFKMTYDMKNADFEAVRMGAHNLYFESAAMIVTLITVGKLLESLSKGRTTDALKSLMELAPQTAVVLRDGVETSVGIDEVKVGDIFVIRPGDSVPVDGVIIDGSGAIDESAMTGESIPVDRGRGDSISAATINRSGFLKARATRVGEDTAFSQIVRIVSESAATKAPIAKVADRVSGIFVPAVLAAALAVVVIWLTAGQDMGYALARGIAVLVVSCPCALGLATPVAIMVGSGVGARNGVLFKTAAAIEETGRIKAVVLDKTGTVTKGIPEVTDLVIAGDDGEAETIRPEAVKEQIAVLDDINCRNRQQSDTDIGLQNEIYPDIPKFDNVSVEKTELQYTPDLIGAEREKKQKYDGNIASARRLLKIAASVEKGSEHPIAAAIIRQAEDSGVEAVPVMNFRAETGRGVEAELSCEDITEALLRFIGINNVVPASDPGEGKAYSLKDEKNDPSLGDANSAASKSEAESAPDENKQCSVRIRGGNLDFVSEIAEIPGNVRKKAEILSSQGKSCLYFVIGEVLIGAIAVADTIKEDSADAIADMHEMGMHVTMITGDEEGAARHIGRLAGVNEVEAGVRPEGKSELLKRISHEHGKTAMVGDGINDAPALTSADVGIAIGAGTDVAIEAADVVLMNSRLSDVSCAIRLGRSTLRNIHQNLFWAFFYNVLLIPLAAGAYVNVFGWTMNPMWAAAAMSVSSFCVVMNALRLNLFRPARHGLPNANGKTGEKNKDNSLQDLPATPDRKAQNKNQCNSTIETGIKEEPEIHSGLQNKNEKTQENLNLRDLQSVDRKREENLKPYNLSNEREKKEENIKMKRKINIEGMMCGHCEATVRNALESIGGVDVDKVSHEENLAVVEASDDVSDDTLKKAVEDKDYKVLSIDR